MSDEKSPPAGLVLFRVCLALPGSAIAGAHYVAVDLPAQKNLQAPENGAPSYEECLKCNQKCLLAPDPDYCIRRCNELACT